MYSRTANAALFALLLGAAAAACAGDAAPSRPEGTAPLVPLPSEGKAPGTENEGLPQSITDIADTERKAARAESVLKLMQLEDKIKKQQDSMDLSGGTNNKTPELIGIHGAQGRLVAEFLIGEAILEARPGEWVTADYRLDQVLANGVVLTKRGENGKKGTQRTVLFGRRTEVPGNVLQTNAPIEVPPSQFQPGSPQAIPVTPHQ